MIYNIKIIAFFLSHVMKLKPNYMLKHGVAALLQTAITLLLVFLPSVAISALSNETSEAALLQVGIFLAVLFVLRLLYIQLMKTLRVEKEVVQSMLYDKISNDLLKTPYAQMENPDFLEQIHLGISPIEQLNVVGALALSIPKLLQSILVIFSVSFIVLEYDGLLILVILAVLLVNYMVNKLIVKMEMKDTKDSLKQNKEYWYYLSNYRNPQLAKDIRVYQMQPFLLKKLQEVFDVFLQSGYRLYGARNIRELVAKVMNVGLMIFMYVFLLYRSMQQDLAPEQLILIVNASLSLYASLNVLQTEYLQTYAQVVYLEEYKKLYDQIAAYTPKGDEVFDEPITSIVFDDVHFTYPGSDVEVLKGLSFSIDEKQTISLVGRNGLGKSTIIKLLSRLFEPTSGRILVNGKDIQSLDYDCYLKQLAIIFQDFRMFHYSIKENVTFNDVDEERLQFALHEADFEKELVKFSRGVDTACAKDMDADGVNLSKGQEQKLAIARSIYKQGSLMILDEPTASLDPLAEQEVFNHFKNITDTKLSIMISHRLSSCRSSDRIILIEDGIVKEDGSHDNLMNQDGVYATMYTLQGSKYQES
ncbi:MULTISPECIES: ABC transporter ATP-binding protein [unclassified Breznakia]|uniref:ABC transporter ATP-binding protein n=1 Tax=unclassified Breznakia TaxID=2623764 RepID=UPI0024734C02|nr:MULTISPECIES: ABC transporter ATP-binding protein [unclassified Breznakia]MDH6366034.1 ATP-binding cassette subfamily B protein [Breznakia sp. PH1-1]MDH6403034.1 ATP-binding cassette subfamily B protein [Breznakia sp. PF1-11]MDH6410743.1 ATP-binding cassette subfamily B protein [Breznakia sp. PFB1-11]MDH6413200.1 ATP-binding cassette subfamily B protein [Breznakia sp. PFB1-14]MDH6415568.1 ATP-binding cassette subfamily B protein [Breznakia sp. PFB1-4]